MCFVTDLDSYRVFAVMSAFLAASCGDGQAPGQVEGEYPVDDPSAEAAGASGSEPEACADVPEGLEDASLAEAFSEHFKVGVALNASVFVASDPEGVALVEQQFNRISPENAMKWASIQPTEGAFTFESADAFVEFGEARGFEIHGHVLVWHQQTPGWVFVDDSGEPAGRELLLDRVEAHFQALAERYGSRIAYWDVVNEALEDSGVLRETRWLDILGPDYIELVFAIAERQFPDSKLIYNDYSMFLPGKYTAAIAMGKRLRDAGVRIDAMGMQGHYDMERPRAAEIEAALEAFRQAEFEVLVTELDLEVLPRDSAVSGADLDESGELSEAVNPYAECLPVSVDERIAAKWASIFGAFARYSDVISSVTFWGLHDGQSWLNNWPVQGRTNYPLLFDRELRPKRAYRSVLEQAEAQ